MSGVCVMRLYGDEEGLMSSGDGLVGRLCQVRIKFVLYIYKN